MYVAYLVELKINLKVFFYYTKQFLYKISTFVYVNKQFLFKSYNLSLKNLIYIYIYLYIYNLLKRNDFANFKTYVL